MRLQWFVIGFDGERRAVRYLEDTSRGVVRDLTLEIRLAPRRLHRCVPGSDHGIWVPSGDRSADVVSWTGLGGMLEDFMERLIVSGFFIMRRNI